MGCGWIYIMSLNGKRNGCGLWALYTHRRFSRKLCEAGLPCSRVQSNSLSVITDSFNNQPGYFEAGESEYLAVPVTAKGPIKQGLFATLAPHEMRMTHFLGCSLSLIRFTRSEV